MSNAVILNTIAAQDRQIARLQERVAELEADGRCLGERIEELEDENARLRADETPGED